jgi:hypothetical protein
MKVTEQDRAAGYADIRVAMLNGNFEVVRVSGLPGEKIVALMQQPMSLKTNYDFVGLVTGKNLEFIQQLHPQSFYKIFLVACSLDGLENLVRNVIKQVGQKLQADAEAEQE